MTGKNLSLKNKLIIQLTPKYRIEIDRLNATLLKKQTPKDKGELLDDEEMENGYLPLGYYASRNPEHLVRGLIIDHVVSEGSRNHLKMDEYTKLFNSHLDKLTKKIGTVTINTDVLCNKVITQEEEIADLNKTIRIMKGQITKLKLKRGK